MPGLSEMPQSTTTAEALVRSADAAARPLRLAVASGKGGTGKTLFATALAQAWSRRGSVVTYVDADVEEPNGQILLSPELDGEEPVNVAVPAMQCFSCERCGKCAATCAFDAIVIGGRGPVIFGELCHGCGACTMVCPDDVLKMQPRPLGVTVSGFVPDPGASSDEGTGRLLFAGGRLTVGEPRSTPLIEALVALRHEGNVIVDCPPGASCAVMAALRSADAVLLVTEPTPFGAHDLRVALDLCDALELPVAVVLNRADLGAATVIEDLVNGRAPLLARMPFDDAIQRAGARGEHPTLESEALRSVMSQLVPLLDTWLIEMRVDRNGAAGGVA